MDISTTYLGLKLKNPLIVASCGLTKTVEKIQQCEDAGAGAVVMKSLFEEQIRAEKTGLQDSYGMHPEVMDYIRAEVDMEYGARDYLTIIEGAKKSVTIPVIASINCFTSKWWTNYAQQIEAAGADALELNVYALPFDFENSSTDLERIYLDVLQSVQSQIKIPVALKLSPYFTAFGHFANRLSEAGADGLVLFNRFVKPEINVNKMSVSTKGAFDDPVGFSYALRWIALLSDALALDLAASGGIRDAQDMIKQLLAGANVVQVASVLYSGGLKKIDSLLDGLKEWMAAQHFETVAEFRGKLSQKNNPQSKDFVRAQYVKLIAGIE
ncbi:dihydroorotate dehydrogenase-like protein [candidate division KSB1 bacterium]|nr:dihydroorotate dehydrogenase-like protein [candidate division KSB1 bacterium]